MGPASQGGDTSNATEGRDTRSSSSPSGTLTWARTFPWGVHGLYLRKLLQRVGRSRTPHVRARGNTGSVFGRRHQSPGGPQGKERVAAMESESERVWTEELGSCRQGATGTRPPKASPSKGEEFNNLQKVQVLPV